MLELLQLHVVQGLGHRVPCDDALGDLSGWERMGVLRAPSKGRDGAGCQH